MKKCKECEIEKPFSEFANHTTSADKLQYNCRACCSILNAEWRKTNRQARQEYLANHRKENRDRLNENSKNYNHKNREARRAYDKNYRENNKPSKAAREAARRADKVQATPYWSNLYLIKKIYTEAKSREKVNHEKYHVDHIVPLIHRLVCGLHVPANLQIITEEENVRKSNKFIPYVESEGNPNLY